MVRTSLLPALAWVVAMVATLPCAAATDLSTGIAALKKGDFVEARSALQRARQRHPTDPRVRLWYAVSLQNADSARPHFAKLAADTTVADSIRGQALWRLAGILSAGGQFDSAAALFAQAAVVAKNPALLIQQALSLVRAGKDLEADSVLGSAIALDSSGVTAAEAWSCRGDLYARQDSCARAIDAYARSIAGADTAPWLGTALAGAYRCAGRLGMAAEAQAYRARLDKLGTGYLEAATVRDMPKPKAQAAAEPAGQPTGRAMDDGQKIQDRDRKMSYAVQVGSFGTAVNAQKLQAKLSADFKDVRVVPFAAKGTTFYRVWLGSFPTKEEAEQFGRDKVKSRKFSYTVVAD